MRVILPQESIVWIRWILVAHEATVLVLVLNQEYERRNPAATLLAVSPILHTLDKGPKTAPF